MTTSHLALSADLPLWARVALGALVAASMVVLVFEARRSRAGGGLVFVSGALALASLAVAILRPTRITETGRSLPSRIVVLADTSRSMSLPADAVGETRATVRDAVIRALARRTDARVEAFGFGSGPPTPFTIDDRGSLSPHANVGANVGAKASDLTTALRALGASSADPPSAVVVVSDGRLDDLQSSASEDSLRALGNLVHAPIHTVATSKRSPYDASIRKVGAVGSAVAHVPLQLRVEVGCAGGLRCDDVPVVVRELSEGGGTRELARGTVNVKDGSASVDLTITLDRAGPRVVEVRIAHQDGDEIPENDRRFVTFHVARERIRVLHIAGRPTNDVRAFRQWIKANPSIDTVAFFILRTPSDTPLATNDELALIPFPVDELFTEHLPSFDAVILQDFDAQPYGLEQHLPALARYVRSGGGLIMVGGLNSFVAGGYAGSPLADVLPTTLDGRPGATAADTSPFVPSWAEEGLAFPALAPLLAAIGTDLPEMPGANVLGDPREGAMVLWTHPQRHTLRGARMPVLAVGDFGNGRSMALGLDGTWQLHFSSIGAKTGGVGYGALWEGLLGWLMHDPRFEPVRAELDDGCEAGIPSTVHVETSARPAGEATAAQVSVVRLDGNTPPTRINRTLNLTSGHADLTLPALTSGGYVAKIQLPGTSATDLVFACESGGDEWADSRPDPDLLARLARNTGGSYTLATTENPLDIQLPTATRIVEERHAAPLLPPWRLSLLAAALLAAHWLLRRRRGVL